MRWLPMLFLLACGQTGPQEPAVAAPPAPGVPATKAAPSGNRAVAAKALFDQAVRAQLAGDELLYQDKLSRLAVEFPDTRHGLAASRRSGGAAGAVAAVGIMAAVAVPAFVKYVERSKRAARAREEVQQQQLHELQQMQIPDEPPPQTP